MTDRGIPRLHLISDRKLCNLLLFPSVAKKALAGGVDAVHLREKDIAAGELLNAARALRSVAPVGSLFVNDRLDIALLCAADGVQLGETSLSVADARMLCGSRYLIGRSIHDVEAARLAEQDGADFVIAGNIYETASKAGLPGRGATFVEMIAKVCSIPIIAIGGVTPERVPKLLAAGAHGVAVISGILNAGDPARSAARYAEALRRG